ncbi:pyridoxal phosphate-dependent aminotransferase [Flexivirga caeni]|nr:histidinol-phosphate transaminase [Flexivirga caeni]
MSIDARTWLDQVPPYRPGRKALTEDGSMASNESPFQVSSNVAAAITHEISHIHRYPDPLADSLRHALAIEHNVDPDQILVGNGSDELIFLLAIAFLAQRGHAVCADPAYLIDKISTLIVGGRVTQVPLKDWKHDLDTMRDVPAEIGYVVNPHNPTGTTHRFQEISEFVHTCRSQLVVVDEAYVDFADDPDSITAMPLARSGEAAVLRTFSKVHGVAGLRIGYLVAHADVITTLRKIRAPFSVGTLAQAGALAALQDPAHKSRSQAHTRALRSQVQDALREAGLEIVPSQANFVLALAADESGLVDRLSEHGVSVRPGSSLGLPGTVRVSVPSAGGLQLLRKALGLPDASTPPVLSSH